MRYDIWTVCTSLCRQRSVKNGRHGPNGDVCQVCRDCEGGDKGIVYISLESSYLGLWDTLIPAGENELCRGAWVQAE
ncbi:hypothetical protein E2C01_012427 [Portunus trituberculatus]|uniref:Uncharacterized protein n=1 Tax=Portunus trituberculatus TaxID=210409 RepID=A0A5B7DDM2_PORTR|nr:hypothetical protein [Portunus trituberculatus]